jgi:hypothetical protein
MMYGLQTRVGKEINHKVVKQILKKDKTKKFSLKIREFDNLKKLIAIFVRKNFSYVSYVYGGFKEIHEQSLKLEIPLLNHDETCYLCRKNRKKTQKVGFFTKLFKKNKTDDNFAANYHTVKPKMMEKSYTNKENYFTVDNQNNKKSNEFTIDQKELNISSKIYINLESNLSCDEINEKLVENLNKLDVDDSKIYNIVCELNKNRNTYRILFQTLNILSSHVS